MPFLPTWREMTQDVYCSVRVLMHLRVCALRSLHAVIIFIIVDGLFTFHRKARSLIEFSTMEGGVMHQSDILN
jgi:hypothetical protein